MKIELFVDTNTYALIFIPSKHFRNILFCQNVPHHFRIPLFIREFVQCKILLVEQIHWKYTLPHYSILRMKKKHFSHMAHKNDIYVFTFRAGPPTERQVKRWAFGLKEMLSDLRGYQEFEVFLQKEFSSENLHFWTMCQTLKGLPLSQVESKVNEIYK